MSNIDLNAKSTSELVALYNEAAAAKGDTLVKRFSDRVAALKRTAAILGINGAPEAKTSSFEATGNNEEAGVTTSNEETTATEETTNDNLTAGGETVNKEQETDMTTAKKGKKTATSKKGKKTAVAKKAKKAKTSKSGKTRGPKPDEGSLVGKGTNRDKLLALFEKNLGKQVSISAMMKAVYGEARKDYKGPVMMVMKGLLIVFKTNKLKLEIRKTRENKENYFGLYKKA